MLVERSTTARIQLAGSPILCARLRRGLRATFERILPEDITAGDRIVAMIDETHPTVMLLEATLPGLDLPDALDDLSSLRPRPRIVVIAATYDPYLPVAQIYPACCGTLVRKQAFSPLLPPVVSRVAGGCEYHQPPPRDTNLTDYEHMLLRLMAVGLDNQQIVDALGCSMNSVYSARSHTNQLTLPPTT